MKNQCSIDGKDNGVLVENVVSLSSADAEEGADLDKLSVMNSVGPDEKDRETSDIDSAVDDDDSSSTEVDQTFASIPKDPCTYCGQYPCDWELFGEDICEECEELVEEKRTNKEVRFHAYRLYTRMRHGVLRKYDRRPLPVCVRGEIMDNWPDPNHVYVGFHAALNNVSDNF